MSESVANSVERDESRVMVSVRGLNKIYRSGAESVHAAKDVELEIREGELFTLLGPSGCGKTTTLRSIAGLETPNSGEIEVHGSCLFSSEARTDLPASDRNLGMVFQSYAIWPHMTVFENVAFPMQVQPRKLRPSKKEIRERVARVLSVVRLEAETHRSATALSGGQQQRLALARALVMEPPLLLLDEPLSNLDAKLREEMRFELRRLQRELGITSIYVTHDQVEALSMSSRIAVMNKGSVEQIGTPREIYEQPGTRFVADFIGATNLLPATVEAVRDGSVTLTLGPGSITVPGGEMIPAGESVLLMVRPENIRISLLGPDSSSDWTGEVLARAFQGDSVEHKVQCGDVELQIRNHPSLTFAPGTSVALDLDAQYCRILR